MTGIDFLDVTEVAGEPISAEQLERLHHRYEWAQSHCAGRDVVECACGTGPGLGLLGVAAATLEAGDVSPAMVDRVRAHYGTRVPVRQFDAQHLPFAGSSKDVVILFEAIYYLPDAARFLGECRRVLRPGGQVLIVTANKDLADFNPSPHSHTYYGVVELAALLEQAGMRAELFGYMPVDQVSFRQRVLRPVKRAVVGLGLMPRTMRGKRLLKRLVFGKPVAMPAEIGARERTPEPLQRLHTDTADSRHKVLYAIGTAK